MRLTLLALLAILTAGCLPTWRVPGNKPGGKGAPRTVAEWAQELDASRAAKADAEQREQRATTGLKTARQDALQSKCRAVMWLGMVGALICIALVFLAPIPKKWPLLGFAACLAIVAGAWFLAWLIPRLWIVVLVAGGLGLVVAVVAISRGWKLDSKTVRQLVVGVGKLKRDVPGYRDLLGGVIDYDVDQRIDAQRRDLGERVPARNLAGA